MPPKDSTTPAPDAPAAPFAQSDLDALATPETHTDTPTVTIPEEIKSWVEKAFEDWTANPTKWSKVVLSSEDAVSALVQHARTYTKQVRANPLTVQVKSVDSLPDGKARLVYRVRGPISRKARTAANAAGNAAQ